MAEAEILADLLESNLEHLRGLVATRKVVDKDKRHILERDIGSCQKTIDEIDESIKREEKK